MYDVVCMMCVWVVVGSEKRSHCTEQIARALAPGQRTQSGTKYKIANQMKFESALFYPSLINALGRG